MISSLNTNFGCCTLDACGVDLLNDPCESALSGCCNFTAVGSILVLMVMTSVQLLTAVLVL